MYLYELDSQRLSKLLYFDFDDKILKLILIVSSNIRPIHEVWSWRKKVSSLNPKGVGSGRFEV